MNPTLDILYILAHPDDESFGHAGTMILAQEMGFRTGYICATRGEAGMIRDETLATRASLAARRELELRRAMTLTGLNELRLLPYRDSGMDGTPENDDPRCLMQADEDEVTAFLVAAIRELRPRVVVGFGPEGVYRHPDHIRIGKLTDRAVLDAAGSDEPGLGDPWKADAHYHVAAPRERMIANRINPESPYFNKPLEYFDLLGSLSADITHWIDISSVGERKFAVLMQHATQISSNNPVTDTSSNLHRNLMSTETLIRQPLPWGDTEDDPITRIRDAYPATYP
jgi:LmbE family N-acetylglucosaminyl deacetylase